MPQPGYAAEAPGTSEALRQLFDQQGQQEAMIQALYAHIQVRGSRGMRAFWSGIKEGLSQSHDSDPSQLMAVAIIKSRFGPVMSTCDKCLTCPLQKGCL